VTLARLEQVARELSAAPASVHSPSELTVPPLEQAETLIATKLFPPRLPTTLIERARLLDELDAARSHPLTLISAAAGSGKTTLLSAWVTGLGATPTNGERATPSKPAVAWLSLDPLDDAPIRFWSSVIAALRTCLPHHGQMARALLHSPQPPPLSVVVTALLNDLVSSTEDIILILDDYHVIADPAIQEAMAFFLDHLPAQLHLILATRSDPALPLARWRVRGHLVEIRSGDLCFTHEETARFFAHQMGLSLSPDAVAILHRRTEGWIAGLQLAALSLRQHPDRSEWIADFTGGSRYLLEYVQQDILGQLPMDLQQFLLQTSILTRMNAVACQAVTAMPAASASQEMLVALERANLFVVLLDEQRQWYRYHDLFREALHARLSATQPDLVPLLHQRAARWYEAQGEWREAIDHALAAADFSLAAAFMEQAAPHLWRTGEADIVHHWISALPDPILATHARLALDAMLHFLNSVHISTAPIYARMVAQIELTITRLDAIAHQHPAGALSQDEISLIARRLHLLRAVIAVRIIMGRGEKEQLRHLAREVDALPRDEEASWQMIPLSFAFWLTLTYQHDLALLVPRLRDARQMIGRSGDPLITFRVTTWLARAYINAGQLRLAHETCTEALALLGQQERSVAIVGYLLASHFDILYIWNRLEEAAAVACRLQCIAQDWQQIELLAMGARARAQLAHAQGDHGAAHAALLQAEALLEQEPFVNNVRWVVETRISVWLDQGRFAEAGQWAAQVRLSPAAWDPLRKWEVLLVVRVVLACQQYDWAVEILERFREQFDQPTDQENTIEWMALYMIALYHAGVRNQAELIAARLLATTAPEGYVRLYLDAGDPMRQVLAAFQATLRNRQPDAPDVGEHNLALVGPYVSRLLTAFGQESQKRSPSSAKPSKDQPRYTATAMPMAPLSRQEVRVLRLLVAGQTNAEIAQSLIVSPNTIKTQISSIYRKLGVKRRAEAIMATARCQLLEL
jgi:LuxR family maltose regulon positive regulatory protein